MEEIISLDENEILIKELTGENNWERISRTPLSEEDMLKYKNKLDWYYVLNNNKPIKEDILDQLIEEGTIDLNNRIVAAALCKHIGKNLDFIKKYKDKLTIQTIISNCNFEARDLAQLITIKPEIGMGVTFIENHNLYPYTVIKINRAGNQIQIQKDLFELIEGCDYSNQNYKITPNPNGAISKVTLRKNGDWGVVNSYCKIFLGSKQCYINPDFI